MFEIKPAFTVNAKGRIVRDGFDLFLNGKWHERYSTKRDAKAALKVMNQPKPC